MEGSDRTNTRNAAGNGDASNAFADELHEYRTIVRDIANGNLPSKDDPNVNKLTHLYDDRIHSNNDAVAYAAQAVKFYGDRYTQIELDPIAFPAGTVGINLKQAPDGDAAHGADNKPVSKDALQNIDTVQAGSAAAKAGLSAGDRIVEIDGMSMTGRTPLEVQTLLDGARGTKVDLTVSHNGETKQVKMERTAQPDATVDGPDGKSGRLGIVLSLLGPDGKHLANSTDNIRVNSDAANTTAKPDDVVVWSVIPNSPGDKAGVQRGDVIRKIDGKPIAGETFDQVLGQLRGDNGQGVDLTVIRKGTEQNVHATRALVTNNDVNTRDMGNGIEYVSMNNFTDSTGASQLQKAFASNPNAKAFVLDLRNNPGGKVEQAVSSLELMVKQGTLYSVRQRSISPPSKPEFFVQTRTLTDKDVNVESNVDGEHVVNGRNRDMPYMLNGRPLVVLTNGDTASAAEIVAGALHDDGVATTIGETSYGKGIGQTESDGNDTNNPYKEKMTSFTWTTPKGTWAGDAYKHRIGLTPDVVVADDLAAGGDPQLDAAVSLLKDKIK